VVIGTPIDTSQYNERNLNELIELTRQAIQAGLEDEIRARSRREHAVQTSAG
jgi:hypothetical protein